VTSSVLNKEAEVQGYFVDSALLPSISLNLNVTAHRNSAFLSAVYPDACSGLSLTLDVIVEYQQ
jgi:hypothetical protein